MKVIENTLPDSQQWVLIQGSYWWGNSSCNIFIPEGAQPSPETPAYGCPAYSQCLMPRADFKIYAADHIIEWSSPVSWNITKQREWYIGDTVYLPTYIKYQGEIIECYALGEEYILPSNNLISSSIPLSQSWWMNWQKHP